MNYQDNLISKIKYNFKDYTINKKKFLIGLLILLITMYIYKYFEKKKNN